MPDTTDNPQDPALTSGIDVNPSQQAEKYLVLSEQERAKGFVRPLRRAYVHEVCGGATALNEDIAETYARDPNFYQATYCVHCKRHRPLAEFMWEGTEEILGS